jgi:hypothetical protein
VRIYSRGVLKTENILFRAVAMGVLHFMIAYSPLIIAFAVSFMIMFPSNDAFSMFPYAIIKVS